MKANSSEIFSRIQAELKANGYREKDVTFSSGKATVFGGALRTSVYNNFGLIVSLSLA